MSERTAKLEKLVRDLYEQKSSDRAEWCDWLYQNHVFVVASYSLSLAKKYNANTDLAFAGAILHDIADTVTSRFSDSHEELSLEIAEGLLKKAGFSEEEIEIVVGDILPNHSCHGSVRPTTLEGKVVATADAIAHIDTDFYLFFGVNHFRDDSDFESVKLKLRKKLDRDYNNKLLFEDEKSIYKTKYESLKGLFN